MSAALFLGVTFGLAVFSVYLGLRPARPSLEAVLVRLERPGPSSGQPTAARNERLGQRVAQTLEDLGADHHRLAADLRLVGRSLESLCAERLVASGVGLALALVPGMMAWAGGLGLPLGLWLGLGLVGGVMGFFLPLATLRSTAEERRRSFRYAFSAFLDLAAVSLSSGAAVEEALLTSARAGKGFAFDELRQVLDGSRRAGESPWATLGRLGTELAISEVSELAATVSLAGTEGARAKDSLLAKATSLRRQRLAEAEAEANRRVERARMPLALQFFGFAVLVMAPALFRVASGLK